MTYRSTSKYIILLTLMFSLLLVSCSDSAAPVYQGSDIQILDTTLSADLEDEFERFSYALHNLDKGVPPLILQTLPKDLPHIHSSSKKKKIFFQSLLPMILLANNEIRLEREQLKKFIKQLDQNIPLAEDQLHSLKKLAKRYELRLDNLASLETLEVLLLRIDIIPAELAMAQAANESAWGTSRFSQQANNLFGEWTFRVGEGIIPEGRPAGETYEVKRFENVYESIRSYLQNLNTHYAYKELRQIRAEARKAGEPLDGLELAEGLFRYSIRGDEYVTDLQHLIQTNRLQRFASVNLRPRG